MPINAALVRFASRLRLATMVVGVGLVLLTLAAVLLPGSHIIRVQAEGLSRPWATVVSVAVVILAVGGLVPLASMLHAVEEGQVFASAATRNFRRFALLFLLSAGANIVLPPLVQLGLALHAGGGRITLHLNDSGLVTLLVGALLFFVARLFDEAARLDEDSRSIV